MKEGVTGGEGVDGGGGGGDSKKWGFSRVGLTSILHLCWACYVANLATN